MLIARKLSGLTRRFKKSSGGETAWLMVIYTVGFALQRLVPVALIPIYTRLLSKEEFGTYSLCLSVIMAFNTLAGLGLNASSVRQYYEFKGTDRLGTYLRTTFLLSFLCSIAVSLVLGVIAVVGWKSMFHSELNPLRVVPLIAVAGVFDTLITFYQSIARAEKRATTFVMVRLAQLVLQGAFSVVLIVTTPLGAVAPLVGYLVGSMLVSGWIVIRFYREVPAGGYSSENARQALAYGVPTLPQKFGNWLNNLSDRIIMARFLPIGEIAVYQIGYNTGQFISMVIGSVNNAFVPQYYEMKEAGESARTIAAVDSAIIALLAMIAVTGALASPEIVYILAPPSFREAARIAPLITGAYYMNGVYTQFLKEYFYNKRTGLASLVVTIPAVLSVPMNIFAIPLMGIAGAATVTMVSFILVTILVIIVGQIFIERTLHNQLRLWSMHALVIAVVVQLSLNPLGLGTVLDMPLPLRGLLAAVFAVTCIALLVLPEKAALQRWFKAR